MQKIRSYISLLLLAVMLFPLMEKVSHQLEHVDENHCGKKELHFCAKEHNCKICDYVFSSTDEPLGCHYEIKAKTNVVTINFQMVTATITSSLNSSYPLRGPPVV